MRLQNWIPSLFMVTALALLAPTKSLGQYSISTIAGGGPNNLSAASASIGTAEGVAFDNAGNLYIADSTSSQVFKISSGTLTLVAGNGTPGYSGDGGPAVSAALGAFGPQGLFVDGSGNIFIADTENSVIREVLASTGNIQTVAGIYYDSSEGSACQADGDGGPAPSAHLCLPYSVFVDGSGNIFIADFGNSVIREVVAGSGNIQTVAGTLRSPGYSGDGAAAASAQLDLPASVYVDKLGDIFIADTFNSVIREVSAANGKIQTVAGVYYAFSFVCNYSGDGAAATSAQLCLPSGVSLDGSGNILIADTSNFAIRAVNPGAQPVTVATVSIAAGDIATVAGTPGTSGFSGNGGSATSAELNYPNDMAVDSSGNIFIADSENFLIREVTASNGVIQTFAGNNFDAYSGDGGSPSNAALNNAAAVFVDATGNVFIADTNNSVIRKVVASTGDIQTVAGNGTAGYSGDGAAAISASLNYPNGVFVDAQGDIFIADTANSAIREVVATTGNIQTVAGTPGSSGYSGDGGPPTSALLDNPFTVVVDISGNIFIADTNNSAIRVVNTGASQIAFGGVTISPGAIQTVAGTPPTSCADPSSGCGDGGAAVGAYLNTPAGIFLDATDNIFIADTFNNVIRKVSATTGIIQTVAGTMNANGAFSGDGNAATSALLDNPYGEFVDASNDIYIADSENDVIREVTAATGIIQTIGGIPANANGFPTPGFSGDGGTATSAELNFPSSVFGTAAGKLYVADTDNSRVRELAPAALSVTIAPSTATVVVTALQQYTATVTGNSNTSVNWLVNGVAGGNATLGTISTAGLFQAPAVVPSPAAVTISAVSQVDNSTSATAVATIANPSSTVTVAVSTTPPVTQIYTGTMQPFIATVSGSTNTAVNWYAEGAQGGDPTFGNIDASGNYTAPASVPSPATVGIQATSQADPTAIGVLQVTIVAAPTASQPAPQTVSPGGTASFSLALNANTGSPNQPITLSCLQSSLPAGGSCVFSPATITPSSIPVPFTLAVTVPASAASLEKPAKFWHDSHLFAAFIPLAALLLVGGKPVDASAAGVGSFCRASFWRLSSHAAAAEAAQLQTPVPTSSRRKERQQRSPTL